MDLESIKKLREETGAGVMDAKSALEASSGDISEAKEFLRAKGLEKASKKSDREIKAGRVFSYIHGGGKVGAIVELGCETDYVAKNEKFEKLGNEIAMQVAAMNPENIEQLLQQAYIRDAGKTISELIKEAISTIGENITVLEISRLSI